MQSLHSALKKYPTIKKYGIYILVAIIPAMWLYSKLKAYVAGGSTGGILSLFRAKDNAANSAAAAAASNNPLINANAPKYGEPINTSNAEGVAATVHEAFGWNDEEDDMVDALNTLTNGSDVKYCCEVFKTRYGASLRAKVTSTLNNSEKARLSVVVVTNWY